MTVRQGGDGQLAEFNGENWWQNGEWLSSCLTGTNFYEVVDNEPRYLEEIRDGNLEERVHVDSDHQFIKVRALGSRESQWMMLDHDGKNIDCMEEVLGRIILAKLRGVDGFFLPYDMIWDRSGDEELAGYVMHPIDMSRFVPIRNYLHTTQAPRWFLSYSLFERIGLMQSKGITMGGFGREQIFVDQRDMRTWIFTGDSLRIGWKTGEALPSWEYEDRYQDGFLAAPRAAIDGFKERRIKVPAIVYDIFSAASLSFYLLFYTHPFVGNYYWYSGSLNPAVYHDYYQTHPMYIFDEEHIETNPNVLQIDPDQEFNAIVLEQWDRTAPELKYLFNSLFMDICYPHEFTGQESYLQVENWLQAINADGRMNDNESSRQDIDFAMYQSLLV